MATNDTVLFSVKGTVATQTHVHTLHFREGVGPTDPAALISSWIGLPRNAYRAMFSADDAPVELVKVSYVCGSLPFAAGAEYIESGSNRLGSRSGGADKAASFLATNVRSASQRAGKRWTGGFFIGGMADGDSDRNTASGAYLALVQSYCDALLAAYGPAVAIPAWRLVVYSRTTALSGGDCLGSSSPIMSLQPNPSVTTMRSRKTGHGT